MTTSSIFTALEDQLEWQRETYRHFHQNPELSGAEHETANYIAAELSAYGYQVHRMGGTGVVGVLQNGQGPVVLARADTDALPVAEQSDLPYASKVPQVMHACGHDMHISALLGAAKLMSSHTAGWSGTYIALFQPAEETAAGAQAMIDDGLVAKVPKPDVAFSQHVMSEEAGVVYTTAGPILSAGDSLRITVYGRGAHGSMPHNSVDPVVLAAAIVMRLQTVVSREIQPGKFAVLTIGALNAGSKSNIISDRAELLLNLRTYDPQVRQTLITAIERIVIGECQAAGSPVEPKFEFYDQFPLTSNDQTVNDKVTAAFTAHFGSERVRPAEPKTASEDFSRVPDAFGVPYTYWVVGSVPSHLYQKAAAEGTLGSLPSNHSPFFTPAIDPTLETMTRTHLVAALAYLKQQ